MVGQDNDSRFLEILQEVSDKHVLIMEDFNYPNNNNNNIDWATYTATSSPLGSGNEEFLQTIQDCFYTQYVLSPTRNDAILDLILSSDPDLQGGPKKTAHRTHGNNFVNS